MAERDLAKAARTMNELSQLILHPDFDRTLEALRSGKVFLPPGGEPQDFSAYSGGFCESGKLTILEDLVSYDLDASAGRDVAADAALCAYDESWLKFDALEGTAYFTAHSLVVVGESDYVPLVLATFYFYTRAKTLTERSEFIKYSEEVDVDYHRDYLRDKVQFLVTHAPEHSILLIDGPLISGDLYTIMADANERLLANNIIPVFFVKNSISNVVTQNVQELQGRYNSDMHWLNQALRPGERSAFFKYQDLHNPKNAKVFSYLKAQALSPQRVEFHADTFEKYRGSMETILDLVYYLVLAQGSTSNPQVRPIAVAEAYARSVLRYIDVDKQFRRAKITPTMNQGRFGGRP